MARKPESVAAFREGRRFAVAGVSRDKRQAANAIYRKLLASGYQVYPVNPSATEVEGVTCYPDLRSIPVPLDGVVVATHPDVAIDVVRHARERGIGHIWFHSAFGPGSVSEVAVAECEAAGMNCIVGGCPLLYCEPVDLFHRGMCWWLRRGGRLPG